MDVYQSLNIALGQGGFAQVTLGQHRQTQQYVAIKSIKLVLSDDKMMKHLQDEIHIMQCLNHEHILQCYDVHRESTCWTLYLEYCNAGTLYDVIAYHNTQRQLPFHMEYSTWYYMKQVFRAIVYLHEAGYVHRDLKPANILLSTRDVIGPLKETIDYHWQTQLVVKLADFGLSKSLNENDEIMESTICGSPLYMAPELLLRQDSNSTIDLWSFGVIMYQLLFGTHPIKGKNVRQLIYKMKHENIKLRHHQFSLLCQQLIIGLLHKNQSERLSWSHFIQHAWFELAPEAISTYIEKPFRRQFTPLIEASNLSRSKIKEEIHSQYDIHLH